jgi:hypothetical protein
MPLPPLPPFFNIVRFLALPNDMQEEIYTLEHLETLVTSHEIVVLQLKSTQMLLTHTAACVPSRSGESKQATAMTDICKELLTHMQSM